LFVPQEVLEDVPVRDDLRCVDEDGVAARMIGMVMRVQQVLDPSGVTRTATSPASCSMPSSP
jgi:hypothetical protein